MVKKIFYVENVYADTKIKNYEEEYHAINKKFDSYEDFENDEEESMSKKGMGCIYEKTYDNKPLKEGHRKRDELINTFYRPHHEEFSSIIENSLKSNNQVLIIDCHSFPKYPLEYESNQEMDRAEICIGTDNFHTPTSLKNDFIN